MAKDGVATPADQRIGARVREARLLINMSQESLGGRLDLTFQQIQKYEKGVNRIATTRLLQIARETGKPFSFFIQDIVDGGIEAASEPPEFDRTDWALLSAISKLPADLKPILTRLILNLVDSYGALLTKLEARR